MMNRDADCRAGARRGLRSLAAGVALVVSVCLAAGTVEARRLPRPAGGISVDVTPLLEEGLDGFAELVRADLLRALAAEFSGRLGPGQRLLVEVRGLSLNGGFIGPETLHGPNDYLDGAVTLIGADGRELASRKILTVLPASSGGPWYLPGGEQRRTGALAWSFASWAQRYMLG